MLRFRLRQHLGGAWDNITAAKGGESGVFYIKNGFFAISFKMNKFREKNKKGDWHWIEKTCGVILPRVPFRKMVLFLSEFLDFLIFGENNLEVGQIYVKLK